jgi:hypothetical protein
MQGLSNDCTYPRSSTFRARMRSLLAILGRDRLCAGGFIRIYRNLTQVATTGFVSAYDPTTQAILRWGGRATNPYQGDGKEFRIYNRALSTTEMAEHYYRGAR